MAAEQRTGSDAPSTDLIFVDPDEVVPTWRIGLWAEPGQGKSVAACTAPGPILVVSADRPTAYMYVRKHHRAHWWDPETGERLAPGADGAVEVPAKQILETRFLDWQTMENVYRYVRENVGRPGAIRTVVLDPLSNIFDYVVSIAPKQKRKDESDSPDYTWVNEKILGFIKSLRPFDVNVILIGHVKEPRKGSVMVGPNFGGPALTEKVLRELDIVAHVELQQLPPRDPDDPAEKPRFRTIGQLQTLDTNLICKDGTNALGAKRVLNLSRWFELATHELGPDADDDLPWRHGEDREVHDRIATETFGSAPAPATAPTERTVDEPPLLADGEAKARLRQSAQGLKSDTVRAVLAAHHITVSVAGGLYSKVPADLVDTIVGTLASAPRNTSGTGRNGRASTAPSVVMTLAKLAKDKPLAQIKAAFALHGIDCPQSSELEELFAHLTDDEAADLLGALA